MKKFIKTLIIFCIVTLFCMIVLIIMLYILPETEQYSFDNNIFIWGDSQTYQGIDLQRLSDKAGCQVYTAATHGSGVYDFLVFTEQIPDSSICFVGYSQCCLLRKKEKDYNRSGIRFSSISTLLKNNYKLNEISKILYNNKFTKSNIFHRESSLYKYCDTIVTQEPINHFMKMYNSKPDFYNDKYSIFLSGIETLYNKKCKIICIGFPYYKDCAEYYRISSFRKKIDNDIKSLAKKYACGNIDTLYLNDTDTLLMHDLTHFNEIGAKRTTDLLIHYMDTTDFTSTSLKFIILNNWSCN